MTGAQKKMTVYEFMQQAVGIARRETLRESRAGQPLKLVLHPEVYMDLIGSQPSTLSDVWRDHDGSCTFQGIPLVEDAECESPYLVFQNETVVI